MSDTLEQDGQLFRGAVPQVSDWLRAWRVCRTPQSFRAAAQNGITESFVQGSRVKAASRKAFASMVHVMACTLRAKKVQQLKAASCMSLALDDRGSYRLLRFKCDAGAGSGDRVTVSGILGVLYRGGDLPAQQIEDADNDYSQSMAESIIRCIETLGKNPLTGLADGCVGCLQLRSASFRAFRPEFEPQFCRDLL